VAEIWTNERSFNIFIWNDFELILFSDVNSFVRIINVFHFPFPYFFFSRSPFFVLSMNYIGGRGERHWKDKKCQRWIKWVGNRSKIVNISVTALVAHCYPLYVRHLSNSSDLEVRADGHRMVVVQPNVAPYDVRLVTDHGRLQSDSHRINHH
jgi:hypothetical protein